MSIKPVTYYQVVCDWPGCEENAHHGEYSAWDSDDGARMDAEWDDNGHRGTNWDATEEWYCSEHPAEWASDHEDGEPFPEPPYLLIHDGDTENDDDDGKVTLVTAAVTQ